MNIIHLTDMHFGPYHWNAYSDELLERINKSGADLVINTGDMTTDSLENEFQQAGEFIAKIACKNVISIMGNHDKFSRRSHDFFRKYIHDDQFIEPRDKSKVRKRRVYMNKDILTLEGYFYEANYVRVFDINNEKIMVVALDTCVMHEHTGFVEPEILHAISELIDTMPHDRILMMTHHSVLSTDNEPLYCSNLVTDFLIKHKIEANFCGHSHVADIVEVKNIIHNHSYRQFMCGSMSSRTVPNEPNMYFTYENFGTESEKFILTHMYPAKGGIKFVDSVIGENT